MKKTTALILVLTMILSTFTVYAGDIGLNDVKNHWAKDNIERLIGLGIVNGYEDGSFKPDNTLKFEEFIKMLITATEEEKPEVLKGEKWYQNYVDTALMKNYITNDMTRLIGADIDRKTTAEIIYNLMATSDKGIVKLSEKEIKYVAGQFTDLSTSDEKVLNIASMGIINGYPDKTFKPGSSLKRCEAAAVILRVIDESIRTPMEIVLPKELSDFPEPDLDYLREYPCHIWNKQFTVSELNKMVRESYNSNKIIDIAIGFMDMVSNMDYN